MVFSFTDPPPPETDSCIFRNVIMMMKLKPPVIFLPQPFLLLCITEGTGFVSVREGLALAFTNLREKLL